MNILCPDPCIKCDPIPAGAEGIFPNPNAEANPFSNFSSEKPDINLFPSGPWGPGVGPGPDGPPLGQHWETTGCLGTCFSTISQEDANLCAAVQQIICDANNNPVYSFCALYPNDPSCNTPNPNPCALNPSLSECQPQPRTIFFNDAASCSQDCGDGNASTITIPAGTFAGWTKAEANAKAQSYACGQVSGLRLCLGNLTSSLGCTGQVFSAFIVASYNAALEPVNLTFEIPGGLPPGTVMSQSSPSSVSIIGVPTTGGDFTFTLTCASALGPVISKQYTIQVKGISTNSPLPDATSGVPYSKFLVASGTQSGTRVWQILSGSLPPGLVLDSATGEIFGTPTDTESLTYGFVVTMTDDQIACSKQFTLTVNVGSECADWTTLAWGAPNYNVFGAGTALAFGIQNNVQVSCGSPNGDSDASQADITGTITYNGPGCNCNLHIEMTQSGNPAFVNGGVQIRIVEGSVILLADDQYTLFGPAIVDQAFSLPDTAGLDIHIEVLAVGDSGEPGDSNLNGFGLNATITNTP